MTTYTHFPVRGGVDSFAIYKEEGTYNTDPGTWGTNGKHFGIVQSIQPSISRNLNKLRGITGILPATNDVATSRDALKILAGRFECGFNVDFQPQEFSFLKLAFGSVSTSGDVKNYPQATAASDADKKKYLRLPSISLATRYDFGGASDKADMAWIFTGMVNNTTNIKAALGEPVACNMAFVGANVKEETTVTDIPYTALSSDDVYHFVDCSVTSYGGAALPYLFDGFEFDIENTSTILGDLGKYEGAHANFGERNVSCKFDLTFEGKKFFTDVVGGAIVSTPITLSKVELLLKKSTSKNLTIHLKNLKIPELNPTITYGEIMKGNITLEAEIAWAVEDADLS